MPAVVPPGAAGVLDEREPVVPAPRRLDVLADDGEVTNILGLHV
jgi:hypothetical protein